METRLIYFWHKNEKKISLKFILVFEPLRFRHTYPSFLLSKLASKLKLIQSVVRLSCYSQGPRVRLPRSQVSGSHVPASQVPKPRVPNLRAPGFQGVGFQSFSLRFPGPRSQVLILIYARKLHQIPFKYIFWSNYHLSNFFWTLWRQTNRYSIEQRVNLSTPSGYFYFFISFFCWNEINKKSSTRENMRKIRSSRLSLQLY